MPKELKFSYGTDERQLLCEKREEGFCFTETIDGESYSVYVSLSEMSAISLQYRSRINESIRQSLSFNIDQTA